MEAQLFVTCIVDAFYPQIGRAVVKMLEQQGVTVKFPEDQTCCGQPAYSAGHRDEARAMAAHTVAVLDATDGAIVVPSGSCAAMIIERYGSGPFLAWDELELPIAGAAQRFLNTG